MPALRFVVNGLVKLERSSAAFWRIDDLSAGREGLDFLRKPAVLVLAEGTANDSRAMADRICDWLNGNDWLEKEPSDKPEA